MRGRNVIAAVLSSAVTAIIMRSVQMEVDTRPVMMQPRTGQVAGGGGRAPYRSPDQIGVPRTSNAPSSSPTPVPAGDAPLTTVHNCRRMGSWGDVCSYKDICYDGRTFYFFTPDGCTDPATCGVFYEDADLREGLIYPAYPVKEALGARFPFNGGALIGKLVHPSVLASGIANITWTDRVMWRLPLHFALDNIWFVSSRSAPVYKARKMNSSGLFDPPLPSLGPGDFIYIPHSSDNFKGEWITNFLQVVRGKGGATLEFADSWGKPWNEKNWVCFKNAVTTGTFPSTVSDMQMGFELRKDMYEHMQVQLPEAPARKVLFWFRAPPLYRSILNTDELLALADYYNVTYTFLTDFPRSFKEQLQLFASHGVVVSPHGAGLVNELFFVPGSAVVEIYPYHFHHNLYPMMAANVGVGHYAVHTWNGSDTWSREKLHFERNCEDLTALEVNYKDGDCRDASTYYRIHVSMRDFEAALVNALEHAGHRTRFRGIAPQRDASSETGWT